MMQDNNKQRRSLGQVLRWHRLVGLCAAVFLIIMALSGGLLNHAESFGLDQYHTRHPLLIGWYGIEAVTINTGFHVNGHWFAQIGETVYRDAQKITRMNTSLVGVVALAQQYVLVAEDEMILILPSGGVLERIDSLLGLPHGLMAGGKDDNGELIVKTKQGQYVAQQDFSVWRASTTQTVAWSQASSLPVAMRQQLAQQRYGNGLSLERVLLDLHSGRLLGQAGVWLMDILTLMIITLAVTGVWQATKRKC